MALKERHRRIVETRRRHGTAARPGLRLRPWTLVLALIPTFAGSEAPSEPGQALTPYQRLLQRVDQDGLLRVIVGFETADGLPKTVLGPEGLSKNRATYRVVRERLTAKLGDYHGSLLSGSDQWLIPYLAMEVDKDALLTLMSSTEVSFIREDIPGKIHQLDSKSIAVNGSGQMLADGWDGSGMAIAVIDSGVDADHPYFGGRVVEEACFSSNSTTAESLCPSGQPVQIGPGAADPDICPGFDCAGTAHGTHVAGIASGQEIPGIMEQNGVAPAAEIIAIKAQSLVNGEPVFYTSDLLGALQYIFNLHTNPANSYRIAAVNMSLSVGLEGEGPKTMSDCDSHFPALSSMIRVLDSLGIAVVAATGNQGGDQINVPACIAKTVAVGYSNEADNAIGTLSNHNNNLVRLLAPGENILSSVPGQGFAPKSGTSMAAPQVAGAFALLRQARPWATNAELEQALYDTGKPLSRGTDKGRRIDIPAALDAIEAYCMSDRNLRRVSISEQGIPGDGASFDHHFSHDGRFVAFASHGENLVPNDSDGDSDIFVYDRKLCRIQMASVVTGGDPAIGDSDQPKISADGEWVVFRSIAPFMVPNDMNYRDDVFLHHLPTRWTTLVSVSSTGEQGIYDSGHPGISADGRYIVFDSLSPNLSEREDTNGRYDVFLRDRVSGTTELVSFSWQSAAASAPAPADATSRQPDISADGSVVVFRAYAEDLVQGAPDTHFQIYAYDRTSGSLERVSLSDSGAVSDAHCQNPAVSADGRYVAFSSTATNLFPQSANGVENIFIRDRVTNTVARVSRPSSGGDADGPSTLPALSADGRYAVFRSEANTLIPGDGNGLMDIFLVDRDPNGDGFDGSDHQIRRISESIDGLELAQPSNRGTISGDGRLTGFSSAGRVIEAPSTVGPAQVYTAPTVPDGDPLPAPENLQVTVVSGSQIHIAWHYYSDVPFEEFAIERRIVPGGSWTPIATVPNTQRHYSDYGLAPRTNYSYRILAKRDFWYSVPSQVQGGTTGPAVPANFSAAVNASRVDLSWEDTAGGVTDFRIERRSLPDGAWLEVAQVAGNTDTYSDMGVACETAYVYRMRAYTERSTNQNFGHYDIIRDGIFSDYTSILAVTTNTCSIPSYPEPISPSGTISTGWAQFSWSGSSMDEFELTVINATTEEIIWQQIYAGHDLCADGLCAINVGLPLTDGDYYWIVTAVNEVGQTPSEQQNFTVATQVHQFEPIGTVPKDYPRFWWPPLQNATWYELWVSGPNGVVYDLWLDAEEACGKPFCEVIPEDAPLSPNTTYTWWVRGYEPGGGHRPWQQDPATFTVSLNAPNAVYPLLSPGGFTPGNNTSYHWVKVPEASWYRLTVQPSVGAQRNHWYRADEICDSSTCQVTNDPRTDSLPAGTHTWWIQTWNSAGSAWSGGQSFYTNNGAPAAPTVLGIASRYGETEYTTFPGYAYPIYEWQDGGDAPWYRVQVVDSAGTEVAGLTQLQLAEDICEAGTCSLQPRAHMPTQGTYWWRVLAGNGNGQTGSEWLSFSHYFPPASPSNLMSPVNATVPGTEPFEWFGNTFESWYQLCIGGPNGYQDCGMWFREMDICVDRVCTVSHTTPDYAGRRPHPLADGAYQWWVQSWGPNPGTTPWSAAGNFTVENPALPQNFEPAVHIAPRESADASVAVVWERDGETDLPVYALQFYDTAYLPVSTYRTEDICDADSCRVNLPFTTEGPFYWRVGAGYSTGTLQWGSWSDIPFRVYF